VQEGIYNKFVETFKEHVKTTSVVGDPFKDDTFQGPQVTKTQFDRILSYIESGKSEGATLIAGGEPHKNAGGKGFFISPTIFTNVKDNMKIYREEVFGPFVVISSFKTEEEAVERANDTTYGLGAAVFTEASLPMYELRVRHTLTSYIHLCRTSPKPTVWLGTLKREWSGSTRATTLMSAFPSVV
jgi:aldehyde dehydrogenase (NAD+)